MNITETAYAIFEKCGVTPPPGASTSAIAEAEQRLGVDLPSEVREFYAFANGMTLNYENFEIVPVEALQIYDLPIFSTYGLAVFTAYQNAHAIACRDPMKGKVIFTPHDDSNRLHSPNLQVFLEAILGVVGAVSVDELCSEDLPPLYQEDHSDRSADEEEAASFLLEQVKRLQSIDEKEWTFFLAVEFVSPRQWETIVPYLESDNFYLSEAAAETLGKMKIADALPFLRKLADKPTTQQWVSQDVQAARDAVDQIVAARRGT